MSYNRHLNFHKRGDNYLVCDICEDKFEESYQLRSHKWKHDEATLPCLVYKNCEKKFKHKGDQKRHSLFAHQDSKDFPCKVCRKMFQSPQSRSTHEKNCIDFMETKDEVELDKMSGNELINLLKGGM